ncbi:MAG TPA: hemolysin family protein [Verrucomicrobiae bacterium]|nr:hemolysin family protein [Verrucomicrobiae bacterium]
MNNLLLVALATLLVLLNGFFVAAEFAIVKLRRAQAKEFAETHGWRGRTLASVRGHLDAYLSACQLGITLASLGLGWIGEPAFARLIEPPMAALGLGTPELVHGVALASAFVAIAFLHIVLGELAPKSMAIRAPEAVSLWTAVPLWAFYWLMYPFIRGLNASANMVLRALGMQPGEEGGEAHSVDEIRVILQASRADGGVDAQQTELATRALDFFELEAGDLMKPQADLASLTLTMSPAQVLDQLESTRHSRYPVFEHDHEGLLGLVQVKDLLAELRHGRPLDLRALVKPALLVHRDLSLGRLLRRFREGRPQLALLQDDVNRIVGFVTLHDVAEALFGRFEDEYGRGAREWKRQDDGSWLGSGVLSVYSLERLLHVEAPVRDIDSVGGLIMWKLDRVPRPGDRASFDGFDLHVVRMNGTRIAQLRVYPRPAAGAAK